MEREELQGDSYRRMLLLEHLETLLEDMDELGIRTRDDLLARIEKLHAELDEAD